MFFLDKVTKMLPGLFSGLGAAMHPGKAGQLGLEQMMLPHGSVQINECVVDHQRLPW